MEKKGNINNYYTMIGMKYQNGDNGKNYIVLEFKDFEFHGGKILWRLPKEDFNKIFSPLVWDGSQEDIEKRLIKELQGKNFQHDYLISIFTL